MTRRSGSCPASKHRGFTLIELLVVIAIIAILVGILLPSLGKSRAISQTLVCQINTKQLAAAAQFYARDFKDRIWPWYGSAKVDKNGRPQGLDEKWCYKTEGGKKVPGIVFQFLENSHKVFECPTNKRRGKYNRTTRRTTDNNIYQNSGALDFDYGMTTFTHGANVGSAVVAAAVQPQPGDGPQLLAAAKAPSLVAFRGVPIFIEESTYWYNDQYQDGLWGNWDQITQRHDKGGHIAYLSGEAELYKPTIKRSEVYDAEDSSTPNFCANDIYVSATRKDKDWHALYWSASNTGNGHLYGWVNNPFRDR